MANNYILLEPQRSALSPPPVGYRKLFIDEDGFLKLMLPSGSLVVIGVGEDGDVTGAVNAALTALGIDDWEAQLAARDPLAQASGGEITDGTEVGLRAYSPLNVQTQIEKTNSLTVGAGKTLTLNGAVTGTPTGGTLNLSNTTLTLGTVSGAALTLSGNLQAAVVASTSYTSIAAGSSAWWPGRGNIYWSADGQMRITNDAANGFTSLTLGVEDASHPQLRRNATAIEIKLGDNSAFAPIKASLVESTKTVRLKGYTVAGLPGDATVGDTAYVTDADSSVYNGALVGGGNETLPVFYDGAGWLTV